MICTSSSSHEPRNTLAALSRLAGCVSPVRDSAKYSRSSSANVRSPSCIESRTAYRTIQCQHGSHVLLVAFSRCGEPRLVLENVMRLLIDETLLLFLVSHTTSTGGSLVYVCNCIAVLPVRIPRTMPAEMLRQNRTVVIGYQHIVSRASAYAASGTDLPT